MADKPRDDTKAKLAFAQELRQRGFQDVRITARPADITAHLNGKVFYFEIKYTSRLECFGAATLTEWEAAMTYEDRYIFVIATNRQGIWLFHEYTPAEFMQFSEIPPFKIFFHITVGEQKATKASTRRKRVQLTRERLAEMIELYRRMQGDT
jgi:hypothetical protein